MFDIRVDFFAWAILAAMLLLRTVLLSLMTGGLVGCLHVQNPPPDFHHPASTAAAEAPVATTSNTLDLPGNEGKP